MKPTKELMDNIKAALESVDYGRVTIEVNATAPHADIIVEQRNRVRIVPDAPGVPVSRERYRQG